MKPTYVIKAELEVVNIARNAMVTTALDVGGGQVGAGLLVARLVEMIAQVRVTEWIEPMRTTPDQATHDRVELAIL